MVGFETLKSSAESAVAELVFHRSREDGTSCQECKEDGLLLSCSTSSSMGSSVDRVMALLAALDARGLVEQQHVDVITSLLNDDLPLDP
jgi:hypothetical protein